MFITMIVRLVAITSFVSQVVCTEHSLPPAGQLRMRSRVRYPRAPRNNATTTATSSETLSTFITSPPTATSSPTTTAIISSFSANNSRENANNPLHTSPYIYYAIGIGIGIILLLLIAGIIGLIYWLRSRKLAQQTRHLQITSYSSASDDYDGKETPGAMLSQWWMTSKLGTYKGPPVQRQHYGTGDFEHWLPQRVTGGTRQMKDDWGAGVNERLLAVQRKMGGRRWERLDGDGHEKGVWTIKG